MEDQFDAVLYLGTPAMQSESKLSPLLCSQPGYLDMRLARLALVPAPANAPITPADSLKAFCASPSAGTETADNLPKLTEQLRQTIREAAAGTTNADRIAPESREALIPACRKSENDFSLRPAKYRL
jgi:hypothetical protein